MTPGWLINRLRLMSVGEVAYRLKQTVVARMEEARLSKGWEPTPTEMVSTQLSIVSPLPPEGLPLGVSNTISTSLCQGKLTLFEYEDLEVGHPVEWHRDPLTRTHSPARAFGKNIDYRDDQQVGDIKVLWELGRQQFLVPIALDYLRDPQPEQLDVIASVLSSWMAQNPYGYGVHWCSSLEVAIRGLSWCITHQLLIAAGQPQGVFSLDIDVPAMKKQIYQHAAFIRNHLSLYSSANNHLIGELTGLHVICSLFEFGKKSRQWKAFAWQSLLQESTLQVHPDGVNKEQAIYYHCWVLEYFLINYLVAGHAGETIPDTYVQQLSKMAQFVHDLCPGDAEPPQTGDADDGIAIRFGAVPTLFHRDLINTVNALAGETSGHEAGLKAFCYQLLHKKPVARALQPVIKTTYPASYPVGGYAVLGAPDFHLVFDCGALGYPKIAAHGHADMLNVCLAIDGEWWLVDPGTFSYHSDHHWRDYFRGSSGHNVLSVNRQNQSEIGGPFMWIRHARAHYDGVSSAVTTQEAGGWHDGYTKEGVPRVSRHLQMCPEQSKLVIRDEVRCQTEGEVDIHYHFHPDVHCITQQDKGVLLGRVGSQIQLHLTLPRRFSVTRYHGDQKEPMGWYSSSLGVKEPCLTIRANTTITETTAFTTTLAVVKGQEEETL